MPTIVSCRNTVSSATSGASSKAMAQFDIHRNADKDQSKLFPFLLDVQHPLHRQFESRVVIPFTLSENLGRHQLPRLNLVVNINGKEYVLLTQQLAAVPLNALGAKAMSAADQRGNFVAALDLLINGI